MRFFSEAPFVRLLFPFLLGIISSVYFLHNETWLIVSSCISIVVLIMVMGTKSYLTAYKYVWLSGVAINCVLFFLAAQLTIHKTEINSVNHFSKLVTNQSYVLAELLEPPIEKDKTLKCIFRIKEVLTDNGGENSIGKILIYIQKDSLAQALCYGDEILFASNVKEIPSPQNPGEFNYKHYLSFHNIYHQQYLKAKQWTALNINSGISLMSSIYKLRNNLLNKLKEQGITGDEYAVGAALILGYGDRLDAEIMSAYASTGTLHVLSVSGLHVGLVFIVFNFCFQIIERFKNGKLIKGILIIVLLWGYAALTGLSPAVLRAATMFSFVVLGKSLRRTTNVYNTLAVSCFVLLLFNPFLIFEVGFQLSYLAVLGIVFLQPLIYNYWYVKNYFADQIWKITSVSIAAQLATLPLSVLYFQQFPNYFLLSNLIVIPISTLVIYNGIFVFAVGSIPWLGALSGKVLYYLLLFLNGSVKFMQNLPYALWQGISISLLETVLMYLMIIFGIIYLFNKKFIALTAALLTITLLLAINLTEIINSLTQQKIIVYNIANTSTLDVIQGNCSYLTADALLTNNKSKMQFHIQHNWCNINVSKNEKISDTLNYIQCDNNRLLRISSMEQSLNLASQKVNYLVLSRNCNVNIKELNKLLNFDLLIMDSSNSPACINKWIAECVKLHKNYYNVVSNGAFVANI